MIPFFLLLLIFLPTSPAVGAVTGKCADCHVMHASKVRVSYSDAPRDYLLSDTCVGCHTGTNVDGTSHTPYVLSDVGISDLSTSLAGGNFYFSDTNQRYGHNPIELPGGADITLSSPPGWETGFDDHGQVGGASPLWGSNDLSCAGTYGCHGTHTDDGIYRTHHYNPSTSARINPSTAAESYRFLYGIEGYEDPDYEFDTTTHNIYLGIDRSGSESSADTPTDTATMGYFCAECHGIFHSGASSNKGVGDSGDTFFDDPWIRHPVDISMPNSGEYSGYSSYNVDAPVASTSVTDNIINPGTTSGDRIVFCLSCHRAHATPYYASLRWDYRGSGGTWTNGCAYCHTSKN